MNTSANVAFLSLALGDFTAVATQLVDKNYWVAGGLTLLGIILVIIYEKLPASTV